MAMETALLGCALPLVTVQLQKLMNRKGYQTSISEEPYPVITAYREGNWFRHARQVVLSLSPLNEEVTRVDVTAILHDEPQTNLEEEVMEEKIVSDIYRDFPDATNARDGI